MEENPGGASEKLPEIGGFPNLYSINLATGAATLIGQVGTGQNFEVYSLALAPIPESSSTGLLVGTGLAGMWLCRRRR